MYIIVVGGGNVGTYLSRMLQAEKHEVLLVEKSRERHSQLASEDGFGVLLGDGCEARLQQEAGFARADVVAAVTGEDEDNLIVAQMAKHTWGVERTIARVNNPQHAQLFETLGIDGVVSATDILYHLIEQEISVGTVVPLAALRRGNIEIVEATLTARSPAVGKQVKDLQLPPKSNIVWLCRGDEGLIASGETVLQEDDLVVALVPTVNEAEIRELL